MSFTRGNDPMDSMEIGRGKDAIRNIIAIKIFSNNNVTVLTDLYVVEKFVERLSKFSIPNDPVFGPQRIVFSCVEKGYRSKTDYSLAGTGIRASAMDPGVVEGTLEYDKTLGEFAGKTVVFGKNMYAIPSFEELRDNGFEHLQICEENNAEKENEERDKAMEESSRQLDRMKKMMALQHTHESFYNNTDPLKDLRSSIKGFVEEAKEKEELKALKKKKKLWLFDIETR